MLGQDLGYSRRVLSGVLNYAETKGLGWEFHDAPAEVRVLPALRTWRPHGVIAHLFDRELAEKLIGMRIPLVSTTDTLEGMSLPVIDVDGEAVGATAADYFLNLGYHHFAYYGSNHAAFSIAREKGFRDTLAKAGYEVSRFHADFLPRSPFDQDWQQTDLETGKWLQALPKPVAILASNDIPGRTLCKICQSLRLSVPGEVAILGVDNDESECRMAYPRLSSIDTPAEGIGRKAAESLASLFNGEVLSSLRNLLPPLAVIARESTDVLATLNYKVRAALDFINSNATQPITVEMVCVHVGCSRRALERDFSEHLGTTIHRRIQFTQIALAKRLLGETELSISTIAERVGFGSLRQLERVFGMFEGSSPSAYRLEIYRS